MRQDIGYQFVRELAAFWAVSEDRVVWHPDGFDWWPGSHRLSVWVSEVIEIDGHTNFKVILRTELRLAVATAEQIGVKPAVSGPNGPPLATVDWRSFLSRTPS